ncbi:hypothetical protein LOTGIDRAFT_112684 [Lottia gigantea]|uniref:Uncharacterized protein n=1 Tax=Lottia gigantea TaxID=225164 RepID=V4CEW9_LOTGI|nr:hypothetical protein LOTGIDRAFT_112684 [Lottia gigantea]ESP00530.1 hypothetical protein LOTGIDRAFT_112684 [Lottia gigantea]
MAIYFNSSTLQSKDLGKISLIVITLCMALPIFISPHGAERSKTPFHFNLTLIGAQFIICCMTGPFNYTSKN